MLSHGTQCVNCFDFALLQQAAQHYALNHSLLALLFPLLIRADPHRAK